VAPAMLLLYIIGTRARPPVAHAPGSPVPSTEAVPV
jgi:hypothetical protein